MAPEDEDRNRAEDQEPGKEGVEGNSPGLQAECERLREELRRVEQERDAYRRMAYDVARKQFEERLPLTEEGLRHLVTTGPWAPVEGLLAELERNPGEPC